MYVWSLVDTYYIVTHFSVTLGKKLLYSLAIGLGLHYYLSEPFTKHRTLIRTLIRFPLSKYKIRVWCKLRIIHKRGVPAKQYQIPWQVNLIGPAGCGGTLVSPNVSIVNRLLHLLTCSLYSENYHSSSLYSFKRSWIMENTSWPFNSVWSRGPNSKSCQIIQAFPIQPS